jgi:hypothetical protein
LEFRISDTFTDSLTHLTGEEQKAVKTTAFDLQINPANRPFDKPSSGRIAVKVINHLGDKVLKVYKV